MQILNDQNQGISSGFGNDQADDCIQGSRSLQLRVHSLEPLLVLKDLQEREKIRKLVIESAVKTLEFGVDLAAP